MGISWPLRSCAVVSSAVLLLSACGQDVTAPAVASVGNRISNRTATADYYGVAGTPVVFRSPFEGLGGFVGYWSYWNFGDGSSGSYGFNGPTHTYPMAGTYTVDVELKVAFQQNCFFGLCVPAFVPYGQRTYLVEIASANHPPAASVGGPYAGVEGATVSFDAAGSSDADGDALTYDWTFGDGSVLANGGPSPTHTYADNGAYTVTVAVTDPAGLSSSASAAVSVANAAPVPGAIAGADIMHGESYSASGTFTDAGTDSFSARVDWGDGTSGALGLDGSGFALNHVYATAGTFTVTVTITDDDGGVGTASATVTVLSPSGGAAALGDQVGTLLSGGSISGTVGAQLLTSTTAAATSFARGNTTAGTGQLGAFINKVQAQVKAGAINAATGAALIAFAQRVLSAVTT